MFYDEGVSVAACGDVIKNGWEALTAEAGSPGSAIDNLRENIKFIADRAHVIIPGHDRPFNMRENGIEYLTDVSWQVQGNFYPRSRDEVLLNLELKGGFCPKT
jgi:glyoxylase-like metal-dependent hydrolase (beta-lactamase superfamily II)